MTLQQLERDFGPMTDDEFLRSFKIEPEKFERRRSRRSLEQENRKLKEDLNTWRALAVGFGFILTCLILAETLR